MNNYEVVFLATLNRCINDLNELDNLIETNGDRQSKVDLELSDWLHKLQYGDDLTDKQLINISLKIRELRKTRESLRNEYELINVYKTNFKQLYNHESRPFLVNSIQSRLSGLNQQYNNRVLTEEEISKTLDEDKTEIKLAKKRNDKYDREGVVKAVLDGLSPLYISKHFNIGYSTVFKIKQQMKEEGLLK